MALGALQTRFRLFHMPLESAQMTLGPFDTRAEALEAEVAYLRPRLALGDVA